MIRSPFALAFLCLAGGLHAAPLANLQSKPFGVLLLGAGWDQDWKNALADMTLKFSPQFPLEFAGGAADVRAIQKAVDRLQAARIQKLVVVPLYAAAHSPLMDETRFILGLRQDPAPDFFAAAHSPTGNSLVRRVQFPGKLPGVMTPAPEDHALVVEVLTSRALQLSQDPAHEALVLVGLAPAAGAAREPAPLTTAVPGLRPPDANEEYQHMLASLAERVRAKGTFRSAHAAVLRPETWLQADRERAEEELRRMVRELGRSQRVLVIPYAITGAAAQTPILHALQGTFMHYNAKGLLPDERIVRWVGEAVRQGAALPDMRLFKDAGRPLPMPAKSRRLQPLGHRP